MSVTYGKEQTKERAAQRKKRGPPATGRTPIVGFRLDTVIMSKVNAFASKHGHETRTAAIRHLIERGVAARPNEADVLMSDDDTLEALRADATKCGGYSARSRQAFGREHRQDVPLTPISALAGC
jgi:hypothetical protein